MHFQFYEIRACVDTGEETQSFLGKVEFDASLGTQIHTPAGAQAEARQFASRHGDKPVFWTIYGRDEEGLAHAIGDFTTFERTLEIMVAILMPLRLAATLIETGQANIAHSALEDICNQSSAEHRL